ncbi:MAG: TonB-dependent receptor [Verrucomicrobiota bacterium]|nr:TonB-dependent receptor [Verrucomicrobiota bacterium]
MKSNQIKLRGARLASVICLLAALAPTSRLIAQSEAPSVPVPAPTKDTYTEDDVVELSPWEVNASADTYYRDKMAVTASGVVASVRETPLSIDIITSEQLRDTGVNDFIDAFRGTAGISTQPDSVMNPSSGFKIRGFDAGRFLRNGYVKYYFQNLDGVDRIEVVRGPVAAFYGQAEPGGVVNYITKKPLFKWQQSIRFTYGSNDFYKVWVDSTGPIIKDMLAYRVVATYQNSGSWKDYVTNERPYVLAALRFKPFEKLSLDIDYEYNLNRQKGAVRSALVENKDYLADYSRWQKIAKDRSFYKAINSDNSKIAQYSPYNLNFFTRYPRAYTADDIGATAVRSLTITGKDPKPWMALGVADPLGNYQEPIIEPTSDFGVIKDGAKQSRDFKESTASQYRHGWKNIKMFENIGAYDPNTGTFKKVDIKAIDMTKFQPIPSLTNLSFPKGYSFNPNGPGAWYFDESHVVTAELKLEATSWLNFKYGVNYYENISNQVQQYNSDTDMDGFTLDAGQGFSNTAGTPTNGATGFLWENTRWVHQMSADIHFDIAESEHNILFTSEYRDDHFKQYNPTTSTAFESIQRSSPGGSLWDIYNDQPPLTNLWADTNIRSFNNGNDTVQTGYGVSYRIKFLDDRMQFWTGVRHERSQQDQINADNATLTINPPITGTTPMYGVSFEVIKKLNVYASYSESYITRSVNQNNIEYYNPYKILNQPALEAWLNDNTLPKPAESTVSLANFYREPAAPLVNPKGIGYELGVKYDVEGSYGFMSGTFAVFHLERQGLVNTLSGDLSEINDQIQYLKSAYPTALKSMTVASSLFNNSGKEQTEGMELNVTYVPIENFQLTASAAYLFKKEVTEFDQSVLYGNLALPPDTDAAAPLSNPTLFYFNEATQSYLARWPSNNNKKQDVGELTDPTVESDAVRLQQDPTYVKEVYIAKYTPELNNVPDLQFNLSARYDIRDGYLKGSRAILSYTFEGDSPVAVGGSSNGTYVVTPFRNPEVHMFDGTIGYKIPMGNNELDLSVTVRNIFDSKYTKGSFGILDPRTIYLNVEYKF